MEFNYTFTKKDYNSHLLYLKSNGKDGKRLDLSGANLHGANLCRADLSGANLSGANLSFANLRNAYLSETNLNNANLSFAKLNSANLSYADLQNANLIHADLRWISSGNRKEVCSLKLEPYVVVIVNPTKVLHIGCKTHTFEEWFNFSDEEIDQMDEGALEWWSQNKVVLKNIIESH